MIFFISFLSVWRPGVSLTIMSENLGIYILMLSFAFIWRGCHCNEEAYFLTGCFLLGLSQAIRPWCVMVVFTIPLLPFFSRFTFKRIILKSMIILCMISIGFNFHMAASKLFSEKDQGSNYYYTLYGQVSGMTDITGWLSAYRDPIIHEALKNNASQSAINAVVIKRIKEVFSEHPELFFNGCLKSYEYYFKTIPEGFTDFYDYDVWVSFLGCLLFLLICDYFGRLRIYKKSEGIKIHWSIILAIGICYVLCAVFKYLSFFWILFMISGIIVVVVGRKDPFNQILILYCLGILMSLPWVGFDGGQRIRIGNDIVLYMFSAIGVSKFLELFSESSILKDNVRLHLKILKAAPKNKS
jgi:hypothetical protein